ncbi:MAG TPA: DnaA/Hda family protein [Spirochaetota bacterium]|nr:DnaA/Hda family protein [Spirochaetota bacterium]HQH98124.1 DnaA/Hda family protein [Spirochaetota bacterium]
MKTNRIQFNNIYNFKTFDVRPGNKKAFKMCSQLASNSWTGPNIMYLYGRTGSGKTHLLISTYHALINEIPKNRIIYIPTYKFVHDFIQSIRERTGDDFVNQYFNLDMLLLDDFDDLTDKEETQTEVCHVINDLYNKGKMIVVSGLFHPKKYTSFNKKLKSRINRGQIIEIQ